MSAVSSKALNSAFPDPPSPIRAQDLQVEFITGPQYSSALLRETDTFLDTQDTSHPFQFPQWSGGETQIVVLRSVGQIRWLAKCGTFYPAGRVFRPIRAMSIYRGPVCDDLEVLEIGMRKIVEECRRRRVAYIEIAPEWTGEFSDLTDALLARQEWKPLPGKRTSLRLNLTVDSERLLAGFRTATRYEIRRSENAGMTVKMATTDAEFREFLDLYTDMARQKQFLAEDPESLANAFRWLAGEPHRGGLFLAYHEGMLLGGAVVIRAATRAWYILGASIKHGKLSAGHLLQWRAMEWSRANGCREYDFGGYREDSKSGPAFFKRGFCDHVVSFLPVHRYVTTPLRHRIFEAATRMRRSVGRSRGA